MKPLTEEWILKAEGDYYSAQREFRARRNPNYDAACFHAQQCIEKYLKARLQEADIPFGRTHDLATLLDLIVTVEPLWEILRSQSRILSAYAIEYRYPGQFADREEASRVVKICKQMRGFICQSMGFAL